MNRVAIALLVGVLASGPAFAGVVFEVETTNHSQSPPTKDVMQVSVEGGRLKMTVPAKDRGTEGEMLYHGDRQEMVVIDHERKTYFVMDQETMNSIAGQVSQAMSQVQEALKQVPEEQRAMVEQMMKQHMPEANQKRQPPKVTKTGEKADKNGFPCVKYEVSREGTKIRELWVTDWSQVEGGKEAQSAFENLADFFAEMMESFESASGTGGFPSQLEDNLFAYMKDLPGYPVVSSEFNEDGSLDSESALRSAKRRDLDPDDFEPPSGYKRQQMLGAN